MKLIFRALLKLLSGLVLLFLLLFLPAGTIHYTRAWILIALLFVPMLLLGVVLFFKSPGLLEKRLHDKEPNGPQRVVITLSAIMFILMFLLSGFDFRFGWSGISSSIVVFAVFVFLLGYALYAETMRENEYLSRTVEVQDGQTVIDTGLYGIVRNPMYFSTLLIFLSMPIILGSLWGFLVVVVVYPPIIVWRIIDEERTLKEGLPGYSEYMEKVKYRLIPFIW